MSFSFSDISFLAFSIFVVAAVGYTLGRINIKGVSLGSAGVFIAALLYGAFFGDQIKEMISIGGGITYYSKALKVVENLGLIFFVTSVGFIAGPNFFKNLKKNFTSYVSLGLSIITSGGLTAVACIFIERMISGNSKGLTAIITGLLSGALTSTPAFSAAKEAAGELEEYVTAGYAIAYVFGVIGLVLFIQLIPKMLHADMAEERRKLVAVTSAESKQYNGKLIQMDKFGLMPFAVAAFGGVLVGSVKFFGSFSLTTTGGTLLMALILGHFGRIGRVSLLPNKKTLETLRELGLILFLIGSGVPGGMNFVTYFKPVYFLYGAAITTVSMVVGYLFARYVFKMSLLNSLGAITGGRTSTPALGILINLAQTDDVTSAYAATYPVSLVAVVIVSQVILLLF